MEPFKKKTSPYYYVRIYTPQEKLGYYEKSTKTKLKREAEAIQNKWQGEANLVKNCSSDSSKEISLILQNLLNYSSSGRLSLDEWDEGADKIDRLINPDPLAHFTLSMWYNHWLNNNDDIAPSTRKVYGASGEELKLHPQSKIKLNRLSSIDCRKLQKAVKDGGKGSRSGNTTNLIVSPLRGCLQDGVNLDKLEEREGIVYLKGSDTPYTGKATSLYENGQKTEANLKDGKRDGLIVLWHENGQKALEQKYKDGEEISAKYWNRKGEPVDSFEEAEAE